MTLLNLLLITITILPLTTATCTQTCGNTTVNYPFGFSPACKFPLTCSSSSSSSNKNKILFHGFPLRNITSDHLLLSLSSNCTRPITSLTPLFSQTHSLTSQTALLLRSCSSLLSTCSLPWNLLEPPSSCPGPHPSNLTCFTSNNVNNLMREEEVSGTGCKYVFSSIVVHDDGGEQEGDVDVSLEFQALQVAWWVTGTCRCHPNADCTTVGASGYRCKCRNGFSGDGFLDGLGCRYVPSGNSLKFVPSRYGRTKILIGGIVAGAALMAIVATMCYFCRRHSTYLKNRTCARRLLSEAAGNSIVPQYSYREIERATNGFSEKQRLGTGAYGTVYSGKLYNNECVAIKKIKHRDTESIDQVMNEIKLISSVSHPNLVRLLGCCIENGEQILVYEYMPNGTLSEHLQREKGKALPWTVRLTIATETAQAIAYLHSAMNPPIYHRDIKSSNILLDYDYKSKVADFGLSRLGMMETSHISTAPQGTPGYVDPQYHQNFHLSDKSDVYSFGVVLVEIITAMKVVDFNRPHTEVNLAALAVDRIGKGCMDEIIDPYIELHRDAWTLSSVHKMAELAFRCLAYHKDMRPSMMEVAHELEQIRLSGWAPLDDNIGMGSSVASSCSSPINGSERSLGGISSKKVVGSRRLIVPQKGVDHLASLEEGKDTSPVSVHDPWLSEQSSPSTNSLLGNVIQ